MSSNIETIERLFDASTPDERAEVQRRIRNHYVESHTGMLGRADIVRVVDETKTLNEAAEKLGVCRRTLQYHMRFFGLPRGGRLDVASTE